MVCFSSLTAKKESKKKKIIMLSAGDGTTIEMSAPCPTKESGRNSA